MRRFVVLGCNNTTASLAEVSQCRIPEASLPGVLQSLRERLGVDELVYLATCHRTELYMVYDRDLCPGRVVLQLGPALRALTAGASELPPVGRCLALQGRSAADHLFRVTAGLDSMMLGEAQILGQVKAAVRRADGLGLVASFLTTLFSQSFRAAKRIRTETSIGRRPVSLVSLAERRLKARLTSQPGAVVVLGAGEMAIQAISLVRKIDERRPILLCNRSLQRGRQLAERVGATYLPLADFLAAPPGCAVLVAATAAAAPLVTRDVAARLAPALVLDLGMPANVAEDCSGVDGIEVVAQGALASEAAANRAARARDLARACEIVAEQLQELAYEVMEHELSPVARRLLSRFREVARAELERAVQNCAPGSHAGIDEMADRLSQRLVRVPMRGLREVAWMHSTAVLDTFMSAVEP